MVDIIFNIIFIKMNNFIINNELQLDDKVKYSLLFLYNKIFEFFNFLNFSYEFFKFIDSIFVANFNLKTKYKKLDKMIFC